MELRIKSDFGDIHMDGRTTSKIEELCPESILPWSTVQVDLLRKLYHYKG